MIAFKKALNKWIVKCKSETGKECFIFAFAKIIKGVIYVNGTITT